VGWGAEKLEAIAGMVIADIGCAGAAVSGTTRAFNCNGGKSARHWMVFLLLWDRRSISSVGVPLNKVALGAAFACRNSFPPLRLRLLLVL